MLKELIEVTLDDPNDFLKVKETLTRIGIDSKKNKTLYQSCHILHKQGKYYLVHFKEMFLLDGKSSDFSEEDKARRNTIANLLQDFKRLKLVDPAKSQSPVCSLAKIKVLTFKEKGDWNLVVKYTIGKKL